MQATDQPRPDAPSLNQTIIVQMVYMKSFKSQNLRKKNTILTASIGCLGH